MKNYEKLCGFMDYIAKLTFNREKEIPENWKYQYQPIDEINPEIYKNILEPITDEEWQFFIHNLPNNKASGPSTITYEMIKHASPEYLNLIKEMISGIFKHGQIPKDWRLANVYPIPKPKLWGCDLVNTRPITLLETVRKLMVAILNQRLSKILKKYNILKGNQFAGLPLSSTFEPIRIIKELINDANENSKELWLLALDMSKAKNQVFTAGGLTPEYDVLVGIDQGEVISPLLWCIYYNPLLCELNKHHLRYKLSTKKIVNIYENIEKEHKLYISNLAYMDDTNIISGNKHELELLLSIADEFYTLNDIQINKDKSELLLRSKNYDFGKKEKININFGDKKISIFPVPKENSIRILGVWFNAYDDRKFVLNQCKNDILNLITNTLKRKVITDKQTAYIFNSIILSRIEYRSQVMIFTEKECNQMMVPYRRMFKNKLKFASTAPNSIVENNLIYNIHSIWANQIQAKINNFFIQINDRGLLGDIMRIRIIDIQNKLWLDKSPLVDMPYQKKEINENNVSIELDKLDISNLNKIIGGHELIINIITPKVYIKYLKQLRKYKLMFLDQLTTLKGDYFLTFWQFKQRRFVGNLRSSNITPKIFSILNDITIEDKYTNLLKPRYRYSNVINNLKGYELISPNECKKKQFIMFWNNGLQIGRIFDEEKKGEEYIIRHYIVTSDKQSIYMEVQTCSGCNFANDTRESKKCLLKLKTSNMFLVGEKTKNFTDKFEKNKTLVLPKTQYVDIFQIMEINQHLNLNPQYYQVMDSRFIIFSKINTIVKQFLTYIDGSAKNIGTDKAESIFVTKALILALLCSIIILPENSRITILTKDKSLIETYNNYRINNFFSLTSRQIFKLKHHNYMWIIIFEIIKTLSLDVNILLVQENDLNFSIFNQHLKDKYNYIQHLGINIKTTSLSLIKFFPKWNGVPIELSLRKFLKIYTNIFNLEQFLNLNRNYKYRKLQVDWEITFYLLQGDQGTMHTDFYESKLKRKKIQFLIEEIPTIEHIKKSCFSIFKD
ncbi:11105_t:CDS:2, partial [Rhizophagus irregularis]